MTFEQNSLLHYGIRGQKWGVRRFQNEDGSLTPEGKERYLGDFNTQTEIFNKAVDRQNADIRRINAKYKNSDLDDDGENLEYTKEVRDAWLKNYYDVLAKDIETDPSTLKGQKWIDHMIIGHKIITDDLDSQISYLEKKIKDKESAKQNKANSKPPKADKESYANKYAKTKMTAKEAYKTAYKDLEKMHPNFDDLPLDKQDELLFNYMNDSGLYLWT